eukprot:2816539-Amphidinium_carterae.1
MSHSWLMRSRRVSVLLALRNFSRLSLILLRTGAYTEDDLKRSAVWRSKAMLARSMSQDTEVPARVWNETEAELSRGCVSGADTLLPL